MHKPILTLLVGLLLGVSVFAVAQTGTQGTTTGSASGSTDPTLAANAAITTTAGVRAPAWNTQEKERILSYLKTKSKDTRLKDLAMTANVSADSLMEALVQKARGIDARALKEKFQALDAGEKRKLAAGVVRAEALRLHAGVRAYLANKPAEDLAACKAQIDALSAAVETAMTDTTAIAIAENAGDASAVQANSTTNTMATAKAEWANYKTLWNDAAKCLVDRRVEQAAENHKAALDKHLAALDQVSFERVDAALLKLESTNANADIVAKLKETVNELKEQKGRLENKGKQLQSEYATFDATTNARVKAHWVAKTNQFNQLSRRYLVLLTDAYKRIVAAGMVAVERNVAAANIAQITTDLDASIAQNATIDVTLVDNAVVPSALQSSLETTAMASTGVNP